MSAVSQCIREGEGPSPATVISGGAAAPCHFPRLPSPASREKEQEPVEGGGLGKRGKGEKGERERALSQMHTRRADRGLYRMALPDLFSLLPQAGCCPWRTHQHPPLAGGTVGKRDREEIRTSWTIRARKTTVLAPRALLSLFAFTWERTGHTRGQEGIVVIESSVFP